MPSLGDRLAALYQQAAAPAPVPQRAPVYANVPVAQAAQRYDTYAATQRNPSRGMGTPQPRRDVVQNLISLAGQRNAPLRNLGISAAAMAPVNRAGPRPGAISIPGVNPVAMMQPVRGRQTSAGQVADALMTLAGRTQAGQQALQNQMFDVQIQQTKDIAGPGYASDAIEDNRYAQQQAQMDAYRRRIDAVQPFEVTPAVTARRGQQQQAAAAFPQMSQQDINRLDDQQLNALLDLRPRYDPLSGPKAGTPRGVNADQYRYTPISQVSASTQATGGQPVQGQLTPEQEAQLFDLDMQRIKLGQQPASGPAYAQSLRDATLESQKKRLEASFRNPGATPPALLDNQVGDSNVLDAVGDAFGFDIGAPIGNAIKEFGGQAADYFFRTPVGEQAINVLNTLNKPYEWNVTESGDQWYNAATGNYQQGDGRVTGQLGGLGDVLAMSPDTAIALAVYAVEPELKDGVIDAYENGYSSPEYIALMEAAGETNYPPQFEPGGFAVHEYLIGQTDDWPPVLRDAVRLGEGVVMDPLTYLTVVGGAGKGVRAIGKAMATADDSSALTRVAGRGLQATGGAMEIGAKAPDMLFEAPIAGFGWARGRGVPTPGKPGAFQLSPDQQAMDAQTQAAHAAGLISRNTDSGETVIGPDQAAMNASLSQPTIPTSSTVEAEANAADGLIDVPEAAVTNEGPEPPEPTVLRPEDDTPTVGGPSSTVTRPDAPEVQRLADPPTSAASDVGITRPSAPVRSASQIPDELPQVQAAVERYGTTIDTTGNIPGQDAYTPVYGGSRLQDAAITRAVVSGDLDAMIRANELAEVTQTLTPVMVDDPWYAPMNTSRGQNVDGTMVVPNMTRQQADALTGMRAPGGRPLNPTFKAAGMGKAVLEKTTELEFMADSYAPLYREIMGENPVNTDADLLFGFTWTGTGATAASHRVQYLMERFVTTSSDEYADAIETWLRTNTGNDVLNTSNGPMPYLQGIPDQFRDEVINRLKVARQNYRDLVNASDDDFASGAWRTNPTGKPQSAVQMGGGLKGSSKQAEKLAEKWIEADTPKRTPADEWVAGPRRGQLRFAESDPLADALLNDKGELRAKGWLGGKMDQAQRAADDTAVANVKNPLLARLNETAAPGFDRKTTEYLNTPLSGWTPPNALQGAWQPSEWTVFDALQWGHNEKVRNPEFDYGAFVTSIGERQAGIPAKYTPAEQRAMTKLAKENGEPKPDFKALTKERAESRKLARVYDGYLRQIRQSSLFGPISGPAGFVGDVVGNSWAAIVNGHFGAAASVLNPVNTVKAGRTFRNTGKAVESVNPYEMQSAADAYQIYPRNAHQAADQMMTPILRETGQVLPHDLYPAGTLREVPVSGMPSLNEAVKNRNPLIKGAANLWTVPAIKDGRTATDLVGRTTLTKRVYQDSIRRDAIPAFRKLIANTAGQANVEQILGDILKVAESSAKEAGVAWKGSFSPADVGKATAGLGTKEQNALMRGWQSELNRSLDLAMAEQKKVYFSYKNTNADEAIGRVFMFHYWQTRATYMHTRAALRNPVLLNGYYKIFEELNERNEAGGMGYLGPVYRFMTSPSGIYAAFDPLGLLIPTTLIDMQDQEGSKLRVLQNQLNPVIGSVLAIAGITDNVPNVTGLRTTERWLINMGNYLTAEGIDVSSVPLLGSLWDNGTMRLNRPIDEAVKSILSEMNEWWAGKGVPVGEFAPFDQGANEKDQLNTWVLKGLEEKYGPSETWAPDSPAWQEMDDALDALTTGVPNEIADEAERQYAMEGLIAAALAPVVPGGVITRSGYRDEQIVGNQAGDPGGDLNRDLATSADPTWTAMHEQWHKIGTPEEQAIFSMYNNMLMDPENMGTVTSRTPSGQLTVLRSSQIAAMSDEEREDFVNRWIAQNPGYGEAIEKMQTQRDAFKAAHPQMADFKEYQKAVYNEETGGPRGFRDSLEKTNPNFKQELDEYRAYLKGEGITGAEMERRLDSWAASPNGYLAAMGLPMKNGDKPLPVYDASKNPYANPALAGMAPQPGGGSTGTGEGKKDTPEEAESTLHDPYWEPDKVAQRLADDVAKYDTVNRTMEQRFGDAWNAQTGEWEDHADSSSERKKLGYDGVPYEYPPKSDLMVAYESWSYDNPNGSVDQWFDWLMNAPGYGAAGDPSATINYGPKEAEAAAASPSGSQSLGGRLETLYAGSTTASGSSGESWLNSTTKSGKATGKGATSIDGYDVSQGYGMTDYAATQVGPNGIYAYTSDYTTDGSPVGHMGLDVAVPDGTELYAPVAGTVVQAGGMSYEQDERYGGSPGTGGLRIELPNGDIVVMAHMKQIDVQVGDYVQAGQPVGYSGVANGAHVHVEYRKYAPGQSSSGYLGMNPLEMLDMSAVQ